MALLQLRHPDAEFRRQCFSPRNSVTEYDNATAKSRPNNALVQLGSNIVTGGGVPTGTPPVAPPAASITFQSDVQLIGSVSLTADLNNATGGNITFNRDLD